jgi:phosphoglycerol transferase
VVAGSGAESGARLHMRYYDFALPLLLMLAGAQLSRSGEAPRARRLLAAAPLVLLLALASQYLLPAYTPNHIDSPALFGVVHYLPLRQAPAILGLLCVLVWIFHARLGTRLFLFGFMPAALLVGGVLVNLYARTAQRPDDYVKAGLYAHQYLEPKEASRLTIVGADIANLFKTRFFLDNTDVRLLRLPQGAAITTASLDYPNGWLLTIGDYQLPTGATRHSGNRGYTLLRVVPPEQANIYSFAEAERDDMRSTGLSVVEHWGRWSEGPEAVFEFARPLPRRLLLRLDAAAYGPNAEQDFQVTIDGKTLPLRVRAEHGVVELRMDTSGAARRIHIAVPRPTSPQELGFGADRRKLGIGLYRMEVIDAAARRP